MPKKSLNEEQKQIVRDKKDTVSAEEIAKDMYGIGTKTVQKYIDSLPKTEEAVEETKDEQTAPLSQAVPSAMRPIVDDRAGSAIMTPGASKHGDEIQKKSTLEYADSISEVYPNGKPKD